MRQYAKFSPLVLVVLFILGAYLVRTFTRPSYYPTSFGKKVQLVEGAPTIPTYPNAILIDSLKTPDEADYTYSSTWQTYDTVANVSLWFLENLPKSGWHITSSPADLQNNDVQLIVIQTTELITNISIIADHESGVTKIVVEDYPFGQQEMEES